MKRPIVYLPLDERPCNYAYPQYIARIGGMELVVPPLSIMGDFKKPADAEALWKWLREKAVDASHAIISMDLLCYGGIVPSRLHHLPISQCRERIDRIATLKADFPHLRIFAFQLITRAPARNGSGEEPDYYEDYGFDIFRYGVISDKEAANVASPEESREKEEIRARVPTGDLEDFLSRREINFGNNIRAIELAARGCVDHLVIPLDDCAEYGYAPSERRRLSQKAAELGILSRVSMYPGADEMGCTLVARAMAERTGFHPKIWTDYSSQTGTLTIPQYEDRTIGETAPRHILNAGGRQASSPKEADIALMVNPPTAFSNRIKFEFDRRKVYTEPERDIPAFMERIRDRLEDGAICVLADCAVPDGADECLMRYLRELNLMDRIDGFSGWNTSSNAMGTAVAHAIAIYQAKRQGVFERGTQALSEEFRIARYVEDWGYMTHVRQDVLDTIQRGDYGGDIDARYLKGMTGVVGEEVTKRLNSFAKENLGADSWNVTAVMPWKRMFEIRLSLEKK